MKKSWVWVIVIIIVILILGYAGRHQIRSMMSGSSTAPAAQTASNATPEPSMSPAASPADNGLTMTRTDPSKGQYIADEKGMTLYSYDKDTKGVSNCNAACAKAWPPYLQTASPAPSALPADFTVIKRADGTMQYAYDDKPLYYYASDAKPGDITGDGVGGVWHLVKP